MTAVQLRTVATRRFEDASYLQKSDLNERANGVMYLGGFVIECMLKALLLERYPVLQSSRSPEKLMGQERSAWSLCYRSHDLESILLRLPQLTQPKSSEDHRLLDFLRQICATWTVYARYSTQSAKMKEGSEFLARVKELKRWLSR